MMLSKVESGKSRSEDSSSGRLLRDIEEISKALYLQKYPPKSLISPSGYRRSKSARKTRPGESIPNYIDEEDSLVSQKGKKSSSIWSWKPLKALTHIRSHRFNCCFFLRVHSIKGLPSNFNDLGLYVHWKRKDELLQTCPARVSEGVAEFEETLMHRCSIYATKNGSQNSTKYEPKLFLLYASVVGASALDIGKHWIDLTRLLPHTFEELEGNKSSSRKWMTNFNLTGKAKGAILSVSFGFSSSGDGSFQSRSFVKVSDLLKGSEPTSSMDQVRDFSRSSGSSMLRRFGSIPGSELTRSITFLYNKLDEEHLGDFEEDFNFYYEHLDKSSESGGKSSGNEGNDEEFTVIEQGIEYPSNDRSEIETIDVAEILDDDEKEEMESNSKGNLIKGDNEVDGENYLYSQEPTIEVLEWMESSVDENGFLQQENFMKTELSKGGKMKKSLSFDDVTESVTNEFLNFLSFEQKSQLDIGSDSEPESPRERLLREFEKDAIASGNPFFYFDVAEQVEDTGAASGDCTPDFDLSLISQAAEKGHDDRVSQSSLRNRRDAKMLENLETEALMQQWGLNETAFQNSPRTSSGGFGSPVYIYPEEPPELPILGEGLDAVIKTKGGGSLRSMSPSLFRNAKNGERLIMQVSRSVVLPAVMGSSGMEILQCWGLVGVEKMRMQANELMPLDDITGKTMQQVAWEALSGSKELQSWHLLPNKSESGENSSGCKIEVEGGPSGENWDDSGCVFLQDLAPLAMDKIAALSIEGLRIQSGLVDEEAPSRIRLNSSITTMRSINFSGKSFSFEGSVDIDELITLSISLDDWMKLDSEQILGENNDQKISMILAAHLRREDKMGKPVGMKCGSLGNNLTIALNVQLRDPFRDHESVGNSMLALIQVERISVPRKSDTYSSRVSERSYNGEEEEEEECIPRFKISEVHLVGLNANKPGKRTHQQSGSRWLQSSGLCKIRKKPLLNNSSAVVRSSSRMMRKAKAEEDTLWSVSSHVHCEGDKWKELSMLNLYARNPDIVFPDETIKPSLV